MITTSKKYNMNGKETLHVLIVEDSPEDVSLIVRELQRHYKMVYERVETEAGFLISMDSEWDIILCDFKLPSFSLDRALEIVRERNPELPFITISGYVQYSQMIDYMKRGVNDFVSKDTLISEDIRERERLYQAIKREIKQYRERKDERRRNDIMIREAYENTIAAWGRAMELRDQYTSGHTIRVTDLSLRLAIQMSISHVEFIDLNRGALLHDIGKMGIPDQILFKQDALTPEEWVIMRRHPIYARDMLAGIPFLENATAIPYGHHERWDGSGYPLGLKGEDIPFLARLFAVVDVYDALTTDRPYRKSWDKAHAIAYLLDETGVTLDPKVVEAFVDMIGRG